ncbi:MAG: hypothetical protein ABIR24_08055 [Verrucomicrobiota bacterium]
MKRKNQTVPTKFAPETRFELVPHFASPFRAAQETAFEKLKGRLLRRLLDDAVQPDLNTPLRRAADDAAALAWTTSFPLLFFPTLLEEKARRARLQLSKQKQVRLRSEALLVEAA